MKRPWCWVTVLTAPLLACSATQPDAPPDRSGQAKSAVKQHASPPPKHSQAPPGIEAERETVTNSIGMQLTLIQAGTFLMGSPEAEENRDEEDLWEHWVRITRPFYLGIYEVTQAEYELVMGYNPSDFSRAGDKYRLVKGRDTQRFPVENVRRQEALEFCQRLSRKEGRTYRLPTEAEWEYACRAGTRTIFNCGGSLSHGQANFGGSRPDCLGRSTTVGCYPPNVFGLYDMHGNISELCFDWYASDYYAKSPADDPTGPRDDDDFYSRYPPQCHVVRGGDWESRAEECQTARRDCMDPRDWSNNVGFRVVCERTERQPDFARKTDPRSTEELYLRGPQVSDATLKRLEGLTQLKVLDVGNSSVTDAGLKQLQGLKNLERLSLERTGIRAAGLGHLRSLSNLKALDLCATRIDDADLEQLTAVTSLEDLNLEGTKVTDAGLRHLERLTNVKVLNLRGQKISDAGLRHLEGLKLLENLNLRGTKVTDAGLSHLEGLANLRELDLSRTEVTDEGLKLLKGLEKLKALDLTETKVSDAGLSHLEGLIGLEDVDLTETKVTDAGMVHVTALKSLTVLNLKRTEVGAGLEQLRRLRNLQRVRFEFRNVEYAQREVSHKSPVVTRGEPGQHKELPQRPLRWWRYNIYPHGWQSMEARLIKVEGEIVVLADSNGANTRMGVFLLSKEDQAYVHTALPLTSKPTKPETMNNSIGMKLVLIPAGDFQMGSGRHAEPQHRVHITRPFYIGAYEVTQAEYQQVMGSNPSQFSAAGKHKNAVEKLDTSHCPVENVDWDRAREFCQRLSQKEGKTYRLPTEAEWEYAYRAGTTFDYTFREDEARNNAHFQSGKNARPTTVGSYQPNIFGLYDMYGNVKEWCLDGYDPEYYYWSPQDDPPGPGPRPAHVVRGDSAGYRSFRWSWFSHRFVGFRVVRER